ncbi:RNA polymerase sigma factor [Streptomyces griseus]|uniref:RNA polymerase sigma factor n=1 Tax=Streptomyces griseus TaxID=1911 RepID=UPI00099C925B|nr:RNA polymerase sigma factor [Streptomyces griseus]
MRERFRAGDPSALGEAYDAHARVLFRYAYRMCGDRAAAEDAVSATFLEAWRCRGKLLAEGGSLRPWLLGIATNVLRGAAREARRRDAALARMPGPGVLPDFSEAVAARLADEERLRAARIALGRLRRREREVFTLVVWGGLDYAAAGEVLGVPVGTVRSRLSRARERLRALAEAELRAERRGRGRRGAGADAPAPGTTTGAGSPSAGASGRSEASATRAWPPKTPPETPPGTSPGSPPSPPVSTGRTVLVPRIAPEKQA